VRTAAASVVATRALARKDSRVLAIVGTGEEARSHIEAFEAVRPFEKLLLWGRRNDAAAALASHARDAGCRDVEVVASVPEALARADVVCTVTGAAEPLLFGRDVRPGTHLCLVGAATASKREVDDDCVARARYFVDFRPSALDQAGELLVAIKTGRISESHIAGEIGEVLGGAIAGRRSESDITIYKSLGVAAQDIAAAAIVYQRAVVTGAGTLAPL